MVKSNGRSLVLPMTLPTLEMSRRPVRYMPLAYLTTFPRHPTILPVFRLGIPPLLTMLRVLQMSNKRSKIPPLRQIERMRTSPPILSLFLMTSPLFVMRITAPHPLSPMPVSIMGRLLTSGWALLRLLLPPLRRTIHRRFHFLIMVRRSLTKMLSRPPNRRTLGQLVSPLVTHFHPPRPC